MIYVLTTCHVAFGKNSEFEETMEEIKVIKEKNGAKLVGFWWSLAGEGNEAFWIYSWKNIQDYVKKRESVWKDKDFPSDKVASMVLTFSDKILLPTTSSPLK